MATNVDVQGTPISKLHRELSSEGVDVPGVKSGRTVKVSLDLLATKKEVQNIDKKGKGYFTSSKQLEYKYPSPKVGDYAYVGSPPTIWTEVDGIWVNTTNPVPDDVDYSNFATKADIPVIGNTEGTVYEGSKGKANADDIRVLKRSKVVCLKDFITSDEQIADIFQLGDKWYLTDTKKIRERTLDEDNVICEIEYPPFPESIYLKEGVPDKIYLFSTENGMTPMSGGSGGLSLGETAGTAYEGSKGKANADAIAKINRSNTVYLQGNITSNTAIGEGNLGDKWYITDTKEIIEITKVSEIGGVRTTDYVPYPDSIFIYKDNPNEIYTFSPEEGMRKNTLSLGETPGTAYEGAKGKANADAITLINRSNVIYLQGNTTSDPLIAGGNLHDKWYLTDTKKIREIVGFTKPLERPITEDYAPIDNSIYIYKNDPGKLYIFSTIFGGMVVISRGDYSTEYLDGQTLENIIASLKDKDGQWKYGIKFPWQLNAQKFLDNFDFGTVEVIPYGDSDYADDIVQFTVEITNNGINAFLQFVIPTELAYTNELNNWHNYRLLTFSKPCGPINYTQLKKFTGNFGLEGFQLFSIMQGSEWAYEPTRKEITDNNLSGVYANSGLIKVMFRAGNEMMWYNLHFYCGENYYGTLPDAVLNNEDWELKNQPAFDDLFISASKGEVAITDDTCFIGKNGNDEYHTFYIPDILDVVEGITTSLYTVNGVRNNEVIFDYKNGIRKADVSSDTTFSITVDSTAIDSPKTLIINQTSVSQMTFSDNIVWLETPDFSQPGVYHVEFKICVQEPTKLLALVTFKEPVVL